MANNIVFKQGRISVERYTVLGKDGFRILLDEQADITTGRPKTKGAAVAAAKRALKKLPKRGDWFKTPLIEYGRAGRRVSVLVKRTFSGAEGRPIVEVVLWDPGGVSHQSVRNLPAWMLMVEGSKMKNPPKGAPKMAAAGVRAPFVKTVPHGGKRAATTNPPAARTAMFKTIAEVKKANKKAGMHWFDKETMAFFNTRIHGKTLYGGRYFVTSERMDSSLPWRFSVREALPNGRIDTVGPFQQFTTLEAARDKAKALAKKQRK